jgi:hypothetical protein
MYFKGGNKKAASRYVRQSKLVSESRNKCTTLLERVEEVISLVSAAESTKQVQQHYIKGNQIQPQIGILEIMYMLYEQLIFTYRYLQLGS